MIKLSTLFCWLALSTMCFAASSWETEEDLPNFFDDWLNIWALIIGAGVVFISSVISFLFCSAADKKKKNQLLGDIEDSTEF